MCVPGTLTAAHYKGQAVTWADFSVVVDITASFNQVYYATINGIIMYDKINEKWGEPLTGSTGIEHTETRRIWVDRFNDQLFAETNSGLNEYDEHLEVWFPATELPDLGNDIRTVEPPRMVVPPPGYNYWSDGRLTDGVDREFPLRNAIDDNSGFLWTSAQHYGPARLGSNQGVLELMPYGLLQNRVDAMFLTDGELWMAGRIFTEVRTGITIFDPTANQFSYIESGRSRGFPAVDINCLAVDDTMIFVGSDEGLLLLDKSTLNVRKRLSTSQGIGDDQVLSIATVGNTIFVGTARGLNAFTVADSIFFVKPESFEDETIYDLLVVDSSVWIASSAGAYRLKLVNGQLQHFLDNDAILFAEVYKMTEYQNLLWFLADDGAVRLDKETGEASPIWLGPARYRPRSLAANESIVAIGTDKGMIIVYHSHPKQIKKEFTTDDGLASNNILALEIDGDYVWVGTDRGLTRFWWNNPDRVD
jgi:ligand-binding sensor domain-containing protein